MNQQHIDKLQQQWLESKASGKCLHIGSGSKPIRGAVNLDPAPSKRQWADVAGMGLALPFQDCTFDTVVSSHVLPLFADVSQALREMARVLVVGGRMAHVVPDLRYAPSRASSSYRFERQYSGWFGPGDFLASLKFEYLNGVLLISIVESFTEFQWSFKVEAVRV